MEECAMKIRIIIGNIVMDGELNSSPTSEKIVKALPLETFFSTWGDEIYFSIPVKSVLDETAQKEVQIGDLAYWPSGNAFCVFFGPTPMSSGGKIIPASPVNIIGKVIGDATRFKKVMGERTVRIEAC
jgi:hypothetical protein